jgi:hypothetical protein
MFYKFDWHKPLQFQICRDWSANLTAKNTYKKSNSCKEKKQKENKLQKKNLSRTNRIHFHSILILLCAKLLAWKPVTKWPLVNKREQSNRALVDKVHI